MGRVIISGVTGSGVTSGDVTITKAMLPQGYTAVTRDSDDEVVSGENPVIGAQNIVLPINGSAVITKGVHNGQGKVTQSIPTLGGQTITPSTAQQVVSSSGKYMTGNITVVGDGDLVPGNIKKGVNIFGINGTWEGYIAGVNDLYKYGAIGTSGGFSSFSYQDDIPSIIRMNTDCFTVDQSRTSLGAGVITNNRVNFAVKTKLCIELFIRGASGVEPIFYDIKAASINSGPSRLADCPRQTPAKNSRVVVQFDISNIAFNAYLAVYFKYSSGLNIYDNDVYRIWIE